MNRNEYREHIHLLMKSACYDELILELKRLQHMYTGLALGWYTGSDDDISIKRLYLDMAREFQTLLRAYGHKK